MTRFLLASVILVAFTSLPAAEPEPKKPAKPVYEEKKYWDQEGINKWYMGRQIAMVMGHQAAGWLDRPEREKEEKPTKLIEALQIQMDDVIGAVLQHLEVVRREGWCESITRRWPVCTLLTLPPVWPSRSRRGRLLCPGHSPCRPSRSQARPVWRSVPGAGRSIPGAR